MCRIPLICPVLSQPRRCAPPSLPPVQEVTWLLLTVVLFVQVHVQLFLPTSNVFIKIHCSFHSFFFYFYSHLRTRLVIVAHISTTQQTTTAQVQLTCAPVRCTAPCNKGIMLGADGCPACVC